MAPAAEPRASEAPGKKLAAAPVAVAMAPHLQTADEQTVHKLKRYYHDMRAVLTELKGRPSAG